MASLVIAALEHVWGVLARLNTPVAVMGGLAMAAWNRNTLDMHYLQNAAAKLNVSAELSQAWQDAFPADPVN